MLVCRGIRERKTVVALDEVAGKGAGTALCDSDRYALIEPGHTVIPHLCGTDYDKFPGKTRSEEKPGFVKRLGVSAAVRNVKKRDQKKIHKGNIQMCIPLEQEQIADTPCLLRENRRKDGVLGEKH